MLVTRHGLPILPTISPAYAKAFAAAGFALGPALQHGQLIRNGWAMEDVWRLSAADLASLVKSKKLSAKEAAQAALASPELEPAPGVRTSRGREVAAAGAPRETRAAARAAR